MVRPAVCPAVCPAVLPPRIPPVGGLSPEPAFFSSVRGPRRRQREARSKTTEKKAIPEVAS